MLTHQASLLIPENLLSFVSAMVEESRVAQRFAKALLAAGQEASRSSTPVSWW